MQHSGFPAVVTVKSCQHGSSNMRSSIHCSGVWESGVGKPQHWVDIYFVDDSDVGHDIKVHISHSRNPTAIPDGSRYPPIILTAGSALAVPGSSPPY